MPNVGGIILIPKKIHYCWFGGNPLTDDVKRYIDTWRKYCPDYEIIEWDESNFDVNENDYCREAYESKKWAFVTDYVRLKVLYEYGGIYMDTDVEVCKNLDGLLNFNAVSGFESKTSIPTGTLAASQGNEWIGMLLRDYDNRHFIRADGSLDLTTNVEVITRLTKEKYGIALNGKRTVFGNNYLLLPFDYLCAKSYVTGEVERTENTLTIHHFSGSWLSDEVKEHSRILKEEYNNLSYLPGDFIRIKVASVVAYYKMGGCRSVYAKIKEKLFSK